MTYRKKVRINVYLDENLKELEHVFSETCDRKSLIGTFLKNLLLYLLEKKGREFTERVIHEVARGNPDVLREIFRFSKHEQEEIPPAEKNSTDFDINVTKFLI